MVPLLRPSQTSLPICHIPSPSLSSPSRSSLQDKSGCPLGNKIPEFNELVHQVRDRGREDEGDGWEVDGGQRKGEGEAGG